MKFADEKEDSLGDEQGRVKAALGTDRSSNQEASLERPKANNPEVKKSEGSDGMDFDEKPTANNYDDANAIATDNETMEESKTEIPSAQVQTNLKFSDFEIIKVLGEGSFGKVFRVKKRDSGVIYAMKSMSKKQLISNNQVRYAVTEAQIMKQLDHSYVLKLMYTF